MGFVGQESFDPLEYKGGKEEAKKRKNERAKMLREDGYIVKSSILKNQLRKYVAFGQPDGRVRDVYMLNIYD